MKILYSNRNMAQGSSSDVQSQQTSEDKRDIRYQTADRLGWGVMGVGVKLLYANRDMAQGSSPGVQSEQT
jgi:hypothetical protein